MLKIKKTNINITTQPTHNRNTQLNSQRVCVLCRKFAGSAGYFFFAKMWGSHFIHFIPDCVPHINRNGARTTKQHQTAASRAMRNTIFTDNNSKRIIHTLRGACKRPTATSFCKMADQRPLVMRPIKGRFASAPLKGRFQTHQ